jgi:hypothetical protein
VLLGAATGRGQLLEEEFDYPPGDTLSRHGWGAHSGAGTNPLLIVPGSLSFPGYRSFSLGNAVALAGAGGEDVDRSFSPATSGELYGYLLVSASTARTGGDYFFHLIEGPGAGTSFIDKVWIKDNGSGAAQFGLTMRASSGATYSPLACAYNATHLLVVKHRFAQGAANDQVSLWIDPDVTQPEGPPSLLVSEPASADPASLSLIALRQGGATTSAALKIDAIRISTLWGEPPAPVALVGFIARRETPGRVRLDWTTLSELNNYGFFVQKSDRREDGFITCPGMLHGAGTSTTSHSYTYIDSIGTPGNFYRLQQIDMDGTLRVSGVVEPSPTAVRQDRPREDALLLSAYPNPFNPTTRLEYRSAAAADVELSIYDLLGRRVETLVSGRNSGGVVTTEWKGARYTGGIYFARLSAPQGTRVVRLLLMK